MATALDTPSKELVAAEARAAAARAEVDRKARELAAAIKERDAAEHELQLVTERTKR